MVALGTDEAAALHLGGYITVHKFWQVGCVHHVVTALADGLRGR